MVQLLWKTVWQFLKKLNIELPYDLAIPLLYIHSKELKVGSQRNIYTFTFIAAQVSTDRGKDKQNVIYTYNGILFSLTKGRKF